MKLESKELAGVIGGAVSAALFTAILNIGKTIFDIGFKIGRTIRGMIWG